MIDIVSAFINFIDNAIKQETFWVAVQAIATAGTLIYLARQTISMRKSLAFDMQWRSKEKTTELATFYSASIIPRMSYIAEVLKAVDGLWFLSCISSSGMQLFTESELNRNLPNYVAMQENSKRKMETIPASHLMALRSLLPQENRIFVDDNLDDSVKHALLITEFQTVRTGMLNDLEHFSMCVNSGIPDEDLLYNLVVQTYLCGVQACYLHIASLNRGEKSEFYTQIIDLYCVWRERYEKSKESQKQNSKGFLNRIRKRFWV